MRENACVLIVGFFFALMLLFWGVTLWEIA